MYPGTHPVIPFASAKVEKDTSIPKDSKVQDTKEREVRRRVTEYCWTNEDDIYLKSLAEKYPKNWGLIAEMFNGFRVAIRTDRRTAKDCEDRWLLRWGSEGRKNEGGEETSPSIPATPSTSQMTTRGVKRSLASVIPSAANASAAEARKRRRHNLMQEAFRKVARRKEVNQKNNRTC